MAWTTIGNGVYLASQYAMLMAIAKLGSPALVGQFSLATAITAPVVIFSQMQLRQLQVTDVNSEYRFADYFCSRLVLSGLSLLAIAVVLVWLRYPAEMNVIIALVALAKVCESLSDIVHGAFQRRERMDYVAASLALKGVISVALLTATLWATQSLFWAVAALALVWGMVFAACDLVLLTRLIGREKIQLAWHSGVQRRLMLLAWPLALTSGLVSLSGNIPRYFLEGSLGKDAVGFFSVVSAPLTLVAILNGALSQATLARAASYYQAGSFQAFERLAFKITALQSLVAVLCTLFFALMGRWLLTVLFTADYAPWAPLLVVMSAGCVFGGFAGFGSTVLSAGRMFRLQLANIVVVVLVQLAMCSYLVSHWGLAGAGWAEFGRYLFSMLFLNLAAVLAYGRYRRGLNVDRRTAPTAAARSSRSGVSIGRRDE